MNWHIFEDWEPNVLSLKASFFRSFLDWAVVHFLTSPLQIWQIWLIFQIVEAYRLLAPLYTFRVRGVVYLLQSSLQWIICHRAHFSFQVISFRIDVNQPTNICLCMCVCVRLNNKRKIRNLHFFLFGKAYQPCIGMKGLTTRSEA